MSKPKWQTCELYFSGDQYFRDVVKYIHKAEKEIFLESYIFDFDGVGLQVLEALSLARNKGVQVRILVDGIGSFNWLPQLRRYCMEKHLKFRSYNALPFSAPLQKILSWRYFRRVILFFRRINKRNHRKIILIDRKILFVGSFNISQVHSEKFMDHLAWRDSGARLEGEEIDKLPKELMINWKPEKKIFKKNIFHSDLIRLNHHLRLRYRNLRAIRKRVALAKKRILITNAYFLPPPSFFLALIRAARRGVYVGLCLPGITDVKIIQWGARSLYYRMLKEGIHIFEYQPRVLHAKTMLIDDWGTIGSMNLNHRSYIHDLEIDIVLDEPESLNKLVQQWDKDIQQSKPITTKEIGRFPFWQRGIANLALWMRYWL